MARATRTGLRASLAPSSDPLVQNAKQGEPVSFRQARPQDFAYCERLYFAEMERTIRELNLDMVKHATRFRALWKPAEVRIIALGNANIGWLQTRIEGDALFLGQLFMDVPFQGQGIGTEVMKRIIGEAADAGQGVTLGVVKTNRALRLYKRLGFQITHEDDRKFYMRRQPAPSAPLSD